MNTTTEIPEEELHAWLDGELPPEREAAVEAYLAAHPEERQRLESYRDDGAALARIFSRVGDLPPLKRPTRPRAPGHRPSGHRPPER
jgi:anti-sigma factor RsiW